MTMAVQMPIIDTSLIPPEVGIRLIASTLEAMRRVQTENPEAWARIEARAAALLTERMALEAAEGEG